MASKVVVASTALLLSFNLLFFTMVSSTFVPVPSPAPVPVSSSESVPVPSPTPVHSPSLVLVHSPAPVPVPSSTPVPSPAPVPVHSPAPVPVPSPTPVPSPAPVPVPSPAKVPVPSPAPVPVSSPAPPATTKCPIDTLKLGVCANVLNGLLNIGQPPKEPCCSLIRGLVNLDAAVCLCTAIKANILGINLNIPLSLSLLLNGCGKTAPPGYQCA